MRIIILFLLLTFLYGSAIAQKGQITECHLKNDHRAKIICKFDPITSFVSIQMDDDINQTYNNGHIYLSDTNEINKFIEELKQGISKLKANELFRISHPTYILVVVADSIVVRNTLTKTLYAPKYRMRMYEVIKGTTKIYISFYSDVADKLLAWLESIKL
jgi:hypothetical protein